MYIQKLKARELVHTYELQVMAKEGNLPAPYTDQITSSPIEDVIAHFNSILKTNQKKELEEYRKKLWEESGVFMHSTDFSGKMVEVKRNKYRGQRGLVLAHDDVKWIGLVLLRESMQSVWLDLDLLDFQPFSKGERDWFKSYEGDSRDYWLNVEVKSNIDGEIYLANSTTTSKLNYTLVNCTNSKGKDVWVCANSVSCV